MSLQSSEKVYIVAGGGIVENMQGDICLIFRRGKWDLPKGKLDEGETIEHCALREVSEETGLSNLEILGLIQKTVHEYYEPRIEAPVVKTTTWYRMRIKNTQVLVPQTEEDITEIKWVSVRDLDAYLANSYPTIKNLIAVYLEQKKN
ncbi:MAG: NUDIX domain-containing protein [Phycisphaerales bacterium]|nr:NUDIX domain-containing protein [Phycisphaerales bacterium]